MAGAQDGRALAAGCAACHGTDGASRAMGRALARLPRDAIAGELRAFRDGSREGTVMPQIARGYSDAEIDALAGWLASSRRAADR